jgi:Mlc titration factor MtfA (ptsG expression regulator)
MLWFSKRRRRARIAEQPLSDEERSALERYVRYYRHLPEQLRDELEGLVRIFLAEKRFEGCGGLEVTDTMRLTIAAHGCILLLGRETDMYPLLHSVLVYPTAYVVEEAEVLPDGTLEEGPHERIGESWERGSLVLAWDEVARGGAADGVNVAFHEFAHQLDDEQGIADGTPALGDRARRDAWARVLGAAYDEHVAQVERGAVTLLDEYGAESPAEFFAVSTECFFERPAEMKSRHPELYAELEAFYRQDPAAFLPPPPIVRRRVRRHPRRRRAR